MSYGIVIALFASVTKASQYLMEKNTLFEDTPLELSWANRFYSTLILVAIMAVTSINFTSVYWYFWPLLLFVSGIYVFTTWLMRQSVQNDNTSEIFPLLSIQPLFVIPTSYLILGEIPTLEGMAGILVLVTGVYLLNMEWNQKTVFRPFIELWKDPDDFRIIIVIILFGFSAPLSKVGVQQTSPLVWTVAIHVVISLVFTGWLLVENTGTPFAEYLLKPRRAWISIAFLSSMTVLLRNIAIKWTLVAYVTSVMQTSIFFTTLIGGLYFNETDLRKRVFACLLVIIGNITVVLSETL